MPQELTKVNGRWQLVGDDHSQDHIPPPPTPGPKPKAKAKPKARAAEKPWWHPIVNELRYAGKQISSLQETQKPGTSQPPWKDPLQVVLERVIPEARLISNIQGSSPVLRQVNAASSFGALQTAGEGLIALGQKILAPGKYADPRRSPPGRALNAITRAGYEMLGAKQPEDLTEGQRGVIDNMGRMAGIEAATLPIGGAVGRRVVVGGTSWAARGLRYGTALGVTHGMGALLQDSTQGNISNMVGALTGIDGVPLSVDPTKDDRVKAAVKSLIPNIVGGELLGLAGSAGARAVGKGFRSIRRYHRAAGANTAHTTAGEKLKARGLVEEIEGQQRFTEQALEKPAPVPIPQTPDQARDAVLARWGRGGQQPSTTPMEPQPVATTNGAELSPAPDAIPVTAPVEPPAPVPREDGPAYQEWLRKNASTAIVPVKPVESAPVATLPRQPLAPRDELRGEGLADPWGMGPDPSSPAQQWLGARTGARQEPPAPAVKESLTAPAAAAEEVAPLDPSSYDPALPEVADVQKLVSQLDLAELQALAVVGADGGPALQHIEDVIASRPTPQPRPEISEAWAGVPTNSLSEIYLNGINDLQPWTQLLDKINLTTLKELSHPEASPRLSQLISDATGKAWDAFDREDMINGIKALSAEGTTILPNRLSGDVRLMRVADLAAAPQEFQYKEGVDAKGVQIASHLRDVKKWDPNAEGVLDVFPDPRDGITKVVEGHGRRALAMRLGVPTVLVKEVNATNVPGARSAGAISNISQGNGTPFDAAKFIKGTGMTDKAQLQAAGIALDRGFGRQGLALSKLPQDIFQEAVNDEPLFSWYVALGESGLDEPGMRGAYQVLKQRPKMTLGAFREVLDQAKQQGNVVASSAQGGLFGDEVLNPMLQRAELSADVRAGLAKDRRLFGIMTRNADTLSEAGNTTIDTAAAGHRVADAQQALGLFDTLKNASGPVGELLSKGAERIAQGENASIVANQIHREIGDSIERELANSGMKATPQELASIPPELPVTDAAGPARRRRRGTPISDALGADLNALGGTLANHVRGLDGYLQGQANRIEARQQALAAEAADVMAELPGIDRATLEAHAVQRLIANGEVRPTEMQPLGLPQAPSADIRAVRRELAAMDPTLPLEDQLPNMPATRQAAADELRLAAEYARQDAEIAWAAEKAAREAEGYDLLPLQEKKAQGLGADWVETVTPEVMDTTVGGSFTTERGGSVYAINPDGGTTRTKGASGGIHQGDVGPKDPSAVTVYVRPEIADLLGGIYAQGQYKPSIQYENGKLLFSDYKITRAEPTAKDKAANLPGKVTAATPRTTEIPFSTSPETGLHPVEFGKGWRHIGSKIDSVNLRQGLGAIGPEVMDTTVIPRDTPWENEAALRSMRQAVESGDDANLVIALGEEGAREFKRLDRAQNSSNRQRAEKASAEFDELFGDLTPEQERLIYGDSSDPLPTTEQIDALITAHSDVEILDPGYLAVLAARQLDADGLARIQQGLPTFADQAALIRMQGARRRFAEAGVPADQIPEAMVRGLADTGFASEIQAAELVENFIDAMRQSVTPEVMDTTVMPPPAKPPRRRIADTLRATLRTLAESDARLYRTIGETVGEASGAPQFTLPADLAKASPRYGRNTLKFESDLDRAAYVLANDKAKGGSKSANKFRNELIFAGFDPDQVAAHGKTVKEAVKAAAQDISGEVVVPVQDFAAGRPRLPLPEQQRQIEGTRAQIDDLQQKLNEGGCGT